MQQGERKVFHWFSCLTEKEKDKGSQPEPLFAKAGAGATDGLFMN